MYKQLIINVTEHETRVALLEDGTIVEIHVDRGDDSDIAGNIYKGRVLRVLTRHAGGLRRHRVEPGGVHLCR